MMKVLLSVAALALIVSYTTVLQDKSFRRTDYSACPPPINWTNAILPMVPDRTTPMMYRDDPGNQRLEFVHIPKTGGTAIEHAAAEANVTWGVCHFWRQQTWCPPTNEYRPEKVTRIYGKSPWHIPPKYFFQDPTVYFHNPYENSTMFSVVRNPYERALSAYYYLAKPDENIHNATAMNQWLQGRVGPLVRDLSNGDAAKPPKAYSQATEHFIPQYDFVFDGKKQLVSHVLHFEFVHDGFADLMKRHGLSIVLPRTKEVGKGIFSRNKKLEVANLTLLTLRLIELAYANDFAAFGYQKISSIMAQQCSAFDAIG